MRGRYLVRRVAFALAVSATSFVGASAITNAASDAPVAGDIDVAAVVYRPTPYGSPTISVDLSAGGSDRSHAYELVDQPQSDGETIGSATVDGHNAALSIEPDAPAGQASFSYRTVDGGGDASPVSTVSFEVANRSPLTRDLTLTTQRDAALDVWPYARDAESGGPFPWTRSGNRITYSDPRHGTIEPFFGADGDEPDFAETNHKAVYVPDPGYVGADSFSYTFTDEDGAKSTARVSVDVVEAPSSGSGELHDVRYRCAVHMRSDSDGEPDPDGRFDADLTSEVARYLGGDVVLEADASVRAPRSLAPRGSYRLRRPTLDLTMQSGAAELLGGVAVSGGKRDLDETGFGQSAIGADLTASATVRNTGPGRVREVAINGLEAHRRQVADSGSSDDLTLSASGSVRRLVAPRRGAVVVSLPRVFGLSLRLDPGLRKKIETVGMRCYAPGSERLELARVPVR